MLDLVKELGLSLKVLWDLGDSLKRLLHLGWIVDFAQGLTDVFELTHVTTLL